MILIIISGFTNTKSQVLISLLFGDKLNSPKTEFGLNAGVNSSTLSGVADAKYNTEFGIGMYFTWKFHENWQLQPELFFRFMGGATKLPSYTFDNPELDTLLENTTLTRQSSYFSLPVHIKYRIWKELRISFAPQISYMTNNKDVFIKNINDAGDILYQSESREHLNKFDFGLSAGISYKLKKGKGMNLEFRYYYGLVDTDNKIPGESLKNRSFCLYVGIPIGAEKKEKEKPDEK